MSRLLHPLELEPSVKLALPALVLVLSLSACSGRAPDGGPDAVSDTLTRRQKDSLLGTLPVPGAAAVDRALRVADSVRARARIHDSILETVR